MKDFQHPDRSVEVNLTLILRAEQHGKSIVNLTRPPETVYQLPVGFA
jgi:hypothetical protein